MVAAKVFGLAPKAPAVDFTANTIRVALMLSTYVFQQDTHQWWIDVNTSEVVGGGSTGYVALGTALGTKSINYDAATNANQFRAAASVWTTGAGGTLTAQFAVVYKDTGVSATSPLLSYVDFVTLQTATNGGTFTITWDATAGVWTATPA